MSKSTSITDLLKYGVDSKNNSFALLFRPGSSTCREVDVIEGEEFHLNSLDDLSDLLADPINMVDHQKILLIAPYRQITERGYTVVDDHKPLISLAISNYKKMPLHEVLDYLPDVSVEVKNADFQPSDDDYARIVSQIIQQEIGTGEGANFVIRRSFRATLPDYNYETGLSIFKNLLLQENGAYWIFFIKCNDITLIGASPERHITLYDKQVSMTPISGTYRYPVTGPTREGLIDFLSNKKEKDELSMVLDEELKMMTRICDNDVKTFGPFLTPMSRLAHTGYRLEGSSSLSISSILKYSMFAPTVTGSPLENATRVIAKYESSGRSYYSGFAALLGNDGGKPTIDSTILIRTAEIGLSGAMTIGLGATLVRTSNPDEEAEETQAKAAALLRAMGLTENSCSIFQDEHVVTALQKHNHRLSTFWFNNTPSVLSTWKPTNCQYNAVMIDNEDAFTSMMEYQLRSMGLKIRLVHYSSSTEVKPDELLIIGPGPGDPRDSTDKRVIKSRKLMINALEQKQPFIAICFGHQILCSILGYQIVTLANPTQGIQKEISFFDKTEKVGFYNTFTALAPNNTQSDKYGVIRIASDKDTGHIFGLRGSHFSSMQFHPESVLTIDGPRIIHESIQQVMMK